NTANGLMALFSNTTGGANTAIGFLALGGNFTGVSNTAIGVSALSHNDAGGGNTAVGFDALLNNDGASDNTAIGDSALANNVSGINNTADGTLALANNNTGANNTAIGAGALANNTAGNNNIALGINAGQNVVTASDTICIGIAGVDVTDGCYIGHVFEEPLNPDNLPMAIDVNGKVGTLPSSRRFKNDIKPMAEASEAILALKPVTFHYKDDNKRQPQFGLIAEEVADVDRNLVALDKEGKPFSVRYDKVNAMLLNEFLKEHKRVGEQNCKIENQERQIHDQQATIIELKSTIAQDEKSLQSRFAEQEKHIETLASNLQRVTAQVEMSKPASKVVVTNP